MTVDQRSWRKNILEGVHVKKLELQCTLFNSELVILLKKRLCMVCLAEFEVTSRWNSSSAPRSVWHMVFWGVSNHKLRFAPTSRRSSFQSARCSHGLGSPHNFYASIWAAADYHQLNRKHQLMVKNVKTNSWREVYPQVNLQNQPPKNPLTSQP